MTRAQGLVHWANRWRQLKAWRRDLSNVKIEISDRSHAARLGTCWSDEQRIVIYRGDSFVGELSTLLHELAHAATIGAAHDGRWQCVFANAVMEVTGIVVVPQAYNHHVLNTAAKEAMTTWWHMSGEADRWALARRLSRV